MSRYKPKEAPVIPVVAAAASGTDREEQMRRWEEEQAQRHKESTAGQQKATLPSPVVSVPAPASAEPPVQGSTAELAVNGAAANGPLTPAASATGYLPMPEFTQPDSQDPETRLEFYSRGILAVQYAARANHERAEQQRLIGLGVRLKAIKEEELHKTAGFESFGDLTYDRFRIKKHQANNIIRVLGVAQALEDVTTQELKERPLRVLVPILETHGPDAVRATWQEAARHGNVTDTALKEAANFLGYAPPKELLQGAEERKETKQNEDPGPSESLRAVERIRELAAKDPDRARQEAQELESAVRELLEELAGNVAQ